MKEHFTLLHQPSLDLQLGVESVSPMHRTARRPLRVVVFRHRSPSRPHASARSRLVSLWREYRVAPALVWTQGQQEIPVVLRHPVAVVHRCSCSESTRMAAAPPPAARGNSREPESFRQLLVAILCGRKTEDRLREFVQGRRSNTQEEPSVQVSYRDPEYHSSPLRQRKSQVARW